MQYVCLIYLDETNFDRMSSREKNHLVNAMLGLSGWILTVSGRSRTILANNIVAATANIIMGLTLIPRFGLVGTAIAALGSVALMNLLMAVEVWYIQRVHAFSIAIAKPLVAAAVTLLAESVIVHIVHVTALRVLAAVLLGLMTYGVMLFALSLAPEDRRLVGKLRARLRRQT